MVALSDRIVTAPEASLAPDLEAGDTALYEPQRGEQAEVTVASIDTSVWCVMPYSSALHADGHDSEGYHEARTAADAMPSETDAVGCCNKEYPYFSPHNCWSQQHCQRFSVY